MIGIFTSLICVLVIPNNGASVVGVEGASLISSAFVLKVKATESVKFGFGASWFLVLEAQRMEF